MARSSAYNSAWISASDLLSSQSGVLPSSNSLFNSLCISASDIFLGLGTAATLGVNSGALGLRRGVLVLVKPLLVKLELLEEAWVLTVEVEEELSVLTVEILKVSSISV